MNYLLQEKMKQIKQMISEQIEVEGRFYNFDELIENEIVSEFPKYSHRMRSQFIKGVELIEELIDYFNRTLDEIKGYHESISTDTKESLSKQITNEKDALAQQTNKTRESLQREIQAKITEWANLKKEIERIKDHSKATETQLGLVTLRDIKNAVPLTTKEKVLKIMKGER